MMIHRAGGGGPIGMIVLSTLQMMELAADLNNKPEVICERGHFEVSADGAFLTYATWKLLTNDVHLFSSDKIISGIAQAEAIFRESLSRFKSTRSRLESSKSLTQFRTKTRLPHVKLRAA